MTVSLSLLGGAGAQFFDNNGNPLAGGKLYSYLAGTTTPQATYTTNSGNVAHSNPIILDASGRVPGGEIWLTDLINYKFVLNTSADAVIGTYDNISSSVGSILSYFSDSTGSSLIGFIQSGTGAVPRTVLSKLRDVVNIMDFIPVGTNTTTTDCQPFIKAAIAELIARGGGILYLPAGTYKLVTTESDGTVSAHFNLKDVEGINFIGYGAILFSQYSSVSSEAILFNLDGARRISFEGFDVLGTFQRTLSVVNEYSISAFYLRSVDRDSESISIRNIRLQNVYSVLKVKGNPLSSLRVRTVLVENVFANNGYYGLNFQENGDNFTAINFRTNQFVRTYFPYGVSDHNVNYTSTNGNVFTDCLIKAYVRDTVNITVNAFIIGNTSNDSHVALESQHAPSTQPVPASLKNIVLNINDLDSSGTGPSLNFAYWQDIPSPTPTPTSSTNLFNNITIRGNVRSFVQFSVAQPTDSGQINLQDFVYLLAGSGDPYDYGFYEKISQYTQGNNTYAFEVSGNNKPISLTGDVYFKRYDGTIVGSFDATNSLSGFEFTQAPNYPYRFSYPNGYSAGENVFQVPGNDSISYGIKLYHSSISTAPNASNSVMKIGTMDTTDRSINTTGTVNASGTDYAEYERNNGLVIEKGSIVGFKADGTLTLTFSESVRFGVKSTSPSFVGGDSWASYDIVGAPPERPTRKQAVVKKEFDANRRRIKIVTEPGDSDDGWQVKLNAFSKKVAKYKANIEAERVKVDRIAYSGKVPVNVLNASPGDYIIASDKNNNIEGKFVKNPTFEQYKFVVGRVNRILKDGRAEIAVIIH